MFESFILSEGARGPTIYAVKQEHIYTEWKRNPRARNTVWEGQEKNG